MKPHIVEFTRQSDTPDADFSHIRGEAVLQKLLRRYPDDRTNLERAHAILRDDANYAPAMHRVARSLHEGRISAFISYRVGVDAAAARTVAEVFRALSARQVEVTFADEFTARISGQDYKSEIEAATRSSHWFLILVSDAQEPSGWCMYETGLFRASATSRKMERLICLHHPKAALPSAIDGFQSVSGDVAQLQRFLDGLFRQPNPLPGWPALNPGLDDAALLEAAQRIAQALRPPRKPVAFNFHASLSVPDPAGLASAADLAACKVQTDRLTANLFGKVEPPVTWGQLIANLPPAGASPDWLDELVVVLRKAGGGNVVRPMTSSFEAAEGGRLLRPVLHAMEHDGLGGDFKFELIFLEDYSAAAIQGVPPRTRALLGAMRMQNRVRWEVLARFAGTELTASSMAACAKSLSRIQRELQSQGGLDARALCSHFSGAAADDMADWVEDWLVLHDPNDGSLSVALRGLDEAGARDGLAHSDALNKRFFDLTFPLLDSLLRGA